MERRTEAYLGSVLGAQGYWEGKLWPPTSFEEQQAFRAELCLVVTHLECTCSTEEDFQAKMAEENLVLQIAMLVTDSKRAALVSFTEANAHLHVPRNKGTQENDKVSKSINN